MTRQRFLSTAHGGRPQSQHESGRALELKLRDVGYRVQVARTGGHRFRIGISAGGPEHAADIDVERFDEHSGQITVNGVRFKVVTSTHGPIHLVEVDGITHRISRDEGGIVRSPVPALVVATPLQAGDEVEAGAPLLVVESMKMETVLRAPFRGRVRELTVSVGSQVEAGARLLRLEPLGDGDEAAGPAPRPGGRAGPAVRAGGRARGRAGRAWPAGPAQPPAGLRHRLAGREAPARQLPGRARRARRGGQSTSWPVRSSCCACSPT